MKFKSIILFLLSAFFCLPALATHLPDSIGVENQGGKKVIIHKLDPKDNYYSVGRRYNVKPAVIIQFNNNAALKVGGTIKVPTEVPFDQQTATAAQSQVTPPAQQQQAPAVQQPQANKVAPPASQPAAKSTQPTNTVPAGPITPTRGTVNDPGTQEYKVAAGETLYAIAKRFNTTPEDIVKLNNLSSNYLSPGQVLKVRANTPAPSTAIADDTRIVAVQDSTAPADSASVRPNRFGLFEKNEKGTATWMEEQGLDPNKKFVLHRSAPIGTVIKIVNPMTSRTTFAKVVGRFTENEATRDVVIVMTKNVAESLGALDKRFHVTLSYGTPNE
ncbi:peptidoglycan-binding protein [Mucilaginibacter hurinus]|uniref:Peptidoglycan-binding protein n=1 Tax=Mucilaginibacter hurinus TaxID=2201324 RepID=A0A367GSI8_9SPHI|nr:LysM peptidoglycan-binding domain-containing protein [Mucilaginibacter hurinus]RCH55806.1 peptidoglycan-binding protein [Mucilaginibacter hurinus]